jgi:hypothetical protein
MRWGASPREVAAQAEFVFTMVTNTAALEAVTGGPDGLLAGLGPNQIYCNMSTVSPARSRALAQQVAMLGARMLDAPVSGSVITLDDAVDRYQDGLIHYGLWCEYGAPHHLAAAITCFEEASGWPHALPGEVQAAEDWQAWEALNAQALAEAHLDLAESNLQRH